MTTVDTLSGSVGDASSISCEPRVLSARVSLPFSPEMMVLQATFGTWAELIFLCFSGTNGVPDPPALPDRDNTSNKSAKPEDYVGNGL